MKRSDMEKYTSILTENRTICKCEHSVSIPADIDKVICSWCGYYIFKNKKDEFKYRMREKLVNKK